jgi:hypothetical protein
MDYYKRFNPSSQFNPRNKIPKILVSSRCDSLGRRTFEMPIVYDSHKKSLVKTPVPLLNFELEHLGRNMRSHECTQVPRTANSKRHGDGPVDIQARMKANLMEPLASIEKTPF